MASSASSRGWGGGWPNCQTHNIVTVRPLRGIALPVHREIAPLVDHLCRETERRGYHLVPGWCWGYACRPIRGSRSPSNHSWGLAVDLNAPTNPMSSRLRTNMPRWMVELWTTNGFGWGGHYRSRPDAMHYEFLGTPADARRRCATLTRPGFTKPATPQQPPAPKGFLDMYSEREQAEIVKMIREIHSAINATSMRSVEMQRIVHATGRTVENPNGVADGTMFGRLRDDSADQTRLLKAIARKLGADTS